MKQKHICYIFGASELPAVPLKPRPGDFVIAADGGYLHVQALGIVPDLILGDFDSLGAPPKAPGVRTVSPEKDDTDMMLAVKTALDLGYHTLVLYGGLGGKRFDHSYANLQTLAYVSGRGAQAYLIGEGSIMTAITNSRYDFPPQYTGFLSVFAVCGTARGVNLTGLKYPLREHTLTGDMPLGVSNAFTGSAASVSVREGTLLLIWEDRNPLCL